MGARPGPGRGRRWGGPGAARSRGPAAGRALRPRCPRPRLLPGPARPPPGPWTLPCESSGSHGPAASLLVSGASPGGAAALRGLTRGAIAAGSACGGRWSAIVLRVWGLRGDRGETGGSSGAASSSCFLFHRRGVTAAPLHPQLAELKQECLAHGLEAKGNKQDLIHRLQAYLEEHGGRQGPSRARAGGRAGAGGSAGRFPQPPASRRRSLGSVTCR